MDAIRGPCKLFFSRNYIILRNACPGKLELQSRPHAAPGPYTSTTPSEKTRIVSTTTIGTYDLDRAIVLDRHGIGCK